MVLEIDLSPHLVLERMIFFKGIWEFKYTVDGNIMLFSKVKEYFSNILIAK